MKFMFHYFSPVSLSAWPTVSREVAALRSGRKPTSSRWRRKLWSSIPYTRSKNSTMGALWSGQKQADMSGSVTDPSERDWDRERKAQHIELPTQVWGSEILGEQPTAHNWKSSVIRKAVCIHQAACSNVTIRVLSEPEPWHAVLGLGLLTELLWPCSGLKLSEASPEILMQINQ